MSADSTLEFLRELERADDAVAAVLAELDELARETERTGERAVALAAFFETLPAERARLAAEVGEHEREAELARRALARAEEELTAAERRSDRERVLAARRDEVRARDALRMAERRAAERRGERDDLERTAERARAEAHELEVRARELASGLAERARLADDAGAPPEPGLGGVSAWATQARAALFVARGALARDRDSLIRQANELGALVLGEPLTAASASLVARRVEKARR